MIQGYAIPNATMLGNNGAYKSEFYKALEGAKAAGATVEEAPCLLARGVEAYNDGLPSTPSLLIVPQFYKAGNLYQDVPPFVAEDTTMRFTVSRNTTATRVNSSGLIESVASGVPRIDWLGQSCPALLVEPSGTNLVFHSEVWKSGNNWTFADGVTSVSASITAPDNTQAVNALSPTSGNSSHFFYSNNPTTITYTSGTIYTQSIFFKKGTGAAGRYVQLTYPNARFTQLGFANFDLQDGVVTASGGTAADTNRNARIENYGNGWYRCIFTATCNSAGAGVGVLPTLITTSGATRFPTFLGVTGDVLYGWGAQIETGSVATTYIPTTVAAVSRAADDISASGALVSGLIGQTEGTIYAEVDVRNFETNARIIGISDGTASNRITLQFSSGSRFRLYANFSATDQVVIDSSAQVSGIYKIAAAYKENDYAFYLNGTQIGTDTSALVPACTSVFLGKFESGSSANFLNNRIRSAALYTTRLSNDQLAELTRL